MKKPYFIFISFLAAFAIMILTANDSLTNSSTAPFGNTGSVGDGASHTCAKSGCHSGTVNSGPGMIEIDLSDIPTAGWRPDETYSIGVDVTQSGIATFGFQATVESASGAKKGQLTGGGQTKVSNTFWISHNTTSSTGNWTFDWTAPSASENVASVIFYAAGNAANGNGTSTGDRIYKTSKSSDVDVFASIENSFESDQSLVIPNPVRDVLVIQGGISQRLHMYNTHGQRIMSFMSGTEYTEVNVAHLNRGLYILTDDKNSFTSKLLLN